jgi:RNA polymerase sigma-70 factor, ECF subfamily
MTAAASCESGALARSDVLACIPHLRAFAAVLTGDRWRADDLVHDTIEQIFNAANRPRDGDNLKVQMFATLHRLHYSAQRPSTEGSAQQRKSPSSKEAGLEPDELLHVLGCLCDEQREALILTVASGLSYQQAAEVCGCRIAAIKSRVSEAWRELSRALRDASLRRKREPAAPPSAIWFAPALA